MMKVSRILVVLVGIMSFITSFFVAVPANVCPSPDILYVGGSGPGNYTAIQEAVNAANPGDTIYVYAGTYCEHVNIGKSLSIIGENKNNTIIDGSGSGNVVFVSANWINISGFTVRNSGLNVSDTGIKLYNAKNCTIANNKISNNQHGIYLTHSSNYNTIVNNTALNNWWGISLGSSNYNTVSNNCALNASKYGNGISIWESSNNIIINNIFSSNWGGYGIYLTLFSNYNTIANNTVLNNCLGIRIAYSSSNIIANNNVSLNLEFGIYLRYSSNNIITGNIVSSHDDKCGILILGSNNNIITNNTALNNGGGITLEWSSDNTIASNTVSNNRCGISLSGSGSNNNTVSNNKASNNRYGICLSWSHSTLVNNMLENNGIFISGHFNTHNIDTTNTANGKPIYYYKNQEDITIDGWSAGQIILANCTNFTIKNVDCSNASIGVQLAYCNYCSIENSMFNNGSYGIYLISSSHNNLSNNKANTNNDCAIYLEYSRYNDISNNSANSNDRYGIYLRKSSYNIISNNNASNNRDHYYGYGIYLEYSSYNNIHNNSASNNNRGFYLYFSSYNNISHNNANMNNWYGIYLIASSNNNIFTNNANLNNYYGIYLDYSSSNTIYHNNFINKAHQAYDKLTNFWDNGYPSGGNFWSDYTGVDEKSGPNQDQPGSDGIGDTPYSILGGSNRDRYPLMYPWGKPRISVEKEFILSEITTMSQGVISAVNIKNIGDFNITSMTIIDEYIENMAPNDPPEVLVTITSDKGEVYAVMPEDLNITFADSDITISFELPLEVIPVFWEKCKLQLGEDSYYIESIPNGWTVGVAYPLYPVDKLKAGEYKAEATAIAYSETGASATETAAAALRVIEPVEIVPWRS